MGLKSKALSQSVLTWARTVLANRLATDGRSWVEWFTKMNSGTINNQWMIVDYNKFVPFQKLQDNTLWIVEQLPGYFESRDVTDYLRIAHWPSFNQPFFDKVRALSGNSDMEKRFGPQYSYSMNPRAKIFRRDAGKVTTREDLHRFMRYDNWKDDQFSAAGYGGKSEPRSPENAIAARNDLIPRNTTVPEQLALRGIHGNTDAKAVGMDDVKNLRFDFVVGPTNDQQPPFAWEGVGEGQSSPEASGRALSMTDIPRFTTSHGRAWIFPTWAQPRRRLRLPRSTLERYPSEFEAVAVR